MPTYNVQDYLPAAMESVINQTFSDIEIICINDGSTDNSLQILEDYARKDNRIKIIEQQNQGVSVARNVGINASEGEYIMFIDPDDTYDLTLCEKVVEKINTEHPDIVMWGHSKIKSSDERECDCHKLNDFIQSPIKTINKIISLQVYIWNKAFRKDFLLKNNIEFPLGITQAEDLIFCLFTFYAKPKYSFITKALYFYTDYRHDSATAKVKDNIEKDLIAYKHLYNSQKFQKQSKKVQIASTQHFLGGSIYYWRTLANEQYREKYITDVNAFLEFVKTKFNTFELLKMSNYQKLKHLLFKYEHKTFFDIFDIRTTGTDKTFILFGKKFRVKRWSKLLREKLLLKRRENA